MNPPILDLLPIRIMSPLPITAPSGFPMSTDKACSGEYSCAPESHVLQHQFCEIEIKGLTQPYTPSAIGWSG